MIPDSFENFAVACERVASTSSKIAKVSAVAEYLRSLPADEAGLSARYFGGTPFAAWEERTTQTGGTLLWRAVAEVSGDDRGIP